MTEDDSHTKLQILTGENQQPVAPLHQTARRLAEVMLLLWAWLTSWWGIVFNSLMLSQNYDVKFLASLVVLLVGLLLTNLLGFLHFRQQRLWFEACLAIVDLDGPYLVYKHGKQVVQGQDCPDYESLRLRNSLWRSLPLAMTTFVLAFRAVLEIPACQAAASISALTIGTYPSRTKDSLWAQNLERDGLTSADVFHVKNVKGLVQNVEPDFISGFKGQYIAELALLLEKDTWAAGHCNESTWETIRLPKSQDRVQNWIQGVVVDLEADGELGGIGAGNLLAFNSVMFQRMKAEAKKEKTEKLLRPAGEKLIQEHASRTADGFNKSWRKTGLKLARSTHPPWNQIVDAVEAFGLLGRDQSMVQSVTSSRPGWVSMKLDDWKFWKWKIQQGWKLRLLQTFGLLLVAVLPIRKRILASCRATETVHIGLVTLHTSLDIICLVMIWLLCAMQPAAHHLGNVAKQSIDKVWPEAARLMHNMGGLSMQEWDTNMPRMLADLMHQQGEGFIKIIHRDFIPALTWDLPFFLRLAAGSLIFLAISGAIAYALRPRLANCLCVGICGPLWLFTAEKGENTENSTIALQAFILMLSRSLLFIAIIMLTWGFVDSFSIQFFFAAICNQVYDVYTLAACLLGMLLVHFMLGLAAIFLTYVHLEEKTPTPEMSSNDYFDEVYGLYGTFQSHDYREP